MCKYFILIYNPQPFLLNISFINLYRLLTEFIHHFPSGFAHIYFDPITAKLLFDQFLLHLAYDYPRFPIFYLGHFKELT